MSCMIMSRCTLYDITAALHLDVLHSTHTHTITHTSTLSYSIHMHGGGGTKYPISFLSVCPSFLFLLVSLFCQSVSPLCLTQNIYDLDTRRDIVIILMMLDNILSYKYYHTCNDWDSSTKSFCVASLCCSCCLSCVSWRCKFITLSLSST